MEEMIPICFETTRPELERARRLAEQMDLGLEASLQRALRIVNAETEAFLRSKRRS